jgi:hypothetical protein
VRISDKFEARLLDALSSLVKERELSEIDHEVTPVQIPEPQPDGSVSLSLGMAVALCCPTMAIGDHALVTGVFEDPYMDEGALRAKTALLVSGLRKQRAAANGILDGGAPSLRMGG